MSESGKLIVYGAAYAEIGEAMKDYQEMQPLYIEGQMGEFDAAIIVKEPSGMIIVSEADSSGRFKSAGKAAVVGAVLGIVFPPSALAMAAVGGAAGAAMVSKHLKRSDMKEIGEVLNPGESGIMLVTERLDENAGAKLFGRAIRKKAAWVQGDAEAIKAAIRQAAGQGTAESINAAASGTE